MSDPVLPITSAYRSGEWFGVFALVSSEEDPTRVLVRGELTVELEVAPGETIAVDGRAAATWVGRTVSGVRSPVSDTMSISETPIQHGRRPQWR